MSRWTRRGAFRSTAECFRAARELMTRVDGSHGRTAAELREAARAAVCR